MRVPSLRWRRCAERVAAGAVLVAIAFVPIVAVAQSIEAEIGNQFLEASNAAGAGQQEGELEFVVARIIRASLSLLGIIMVALLVYGGYLWMTAMGNEEQITKAKQIIRNAIIGIAIVLSAYAISVFVIRKLLQSASSVGTPLG